MHTSINAAIEILEKQFELVQEALAEVEGLKSGKMQEAAARPCLARIFQMAVRCDSSNHFRICFTLASIGTSTNSTHIGYVA